MHDKFPLKIKIRGLINFYTCLAGQKIINLFNHWLSTILDANIVMLSIALYSQLLLLPCNVNCLVSINWNILNRNLVLLDAV